MLKNYFKTRFARTLLYIWAIYGTNRLICSYNEKDFVLKKPIGVVADDIESINIDRKIDLDFANFVASRYKT